MIKFITFCTLSIFDYFHKKKIIKFLKLNKNHYINLFIDIGAHKGESIKFFSDNLKLKKIISFEASKENFKFLKNKYNNMKNVTLENIALSSDISEKKFNQCKESSSSTFSKINLNSKYLFNKMKYLNYSKSENFYEEQSIKTDTLDNYLNKNNIYNIDLIKIDTEGHEFEILKGLKQNIKNVKIIIFEHHYDNMLAKNYTFSDIHNYLEKNSFNNIFKIKMPFRKSFEYIYENNR